LATITALIVAFSFGFIGVPIGAAFIVGAITAAFFFTPHLLYTYPTVILRPFDNFTLLAVPLFIIAAEFILRAGVGQILVRAAGRGIGDRALPAGVVGIGMFFAGITGSSVAEASALGRLLLPLLASRGFRKNDVAALMAVTGTLGILIPPSIPLILYGLLTETSISRLFLAGVVPGFLFGTILIVAGTFWVRRDAPLESEAEVTARSREGSGHLSFMFIIALSLPVLMLGGIYGGIGTPTEVAALVAFYAAAIMIIRQPKLAPKQLLKASQDTASATASLFFILIGTSMIGFLATGERIPQEVAQWIAARGDGMSMMLLVVPLLFPAAKALGVDPVHFGIVVVVNIEIGLIHPPVGMNLFAISAATEQDIKGVTRSVLPYLPVALGFLLLVTFFPWLSVGLIR
jgi:C4-dicarboxylate transporter DctM subunit